MDNGVTRISKEPFHLKRVGEKERRRRREREPNEETLNHRSWPGPGLQEGGQGYRDEYL